MIIDTMVKDSRKAVITDEKEGWAVWANGAWVATFQSYIDAQEYVDCKFLEAE